MKQLSNTDADCEVQNENGIVDEKQPLNNGIADRVHIIEMADQTDNVHVPRIDSEKPPLFHKSSKRKYRTYDIGKRNCRPMNLTPLTASGIRIENRLKDKTGLTRAGLILAILCVLLTIALIVCIILLLMKSASEKKVCVKPSCLRSSAEILSRLHLNDNPCVNFRGFACANWFFSKPLPKDRVEWDMKEMMLRKYREEVQVLLLKNKASSNTAASKKMKNFYDSCMDFNYGDLERVQITIALLGGWALYEEVDPSWNMYSALEKLHSEHDVSPLFRIDVVPDPIDPTRNVIYLKPPSLTILDINRYNPRGKLSIHESMMVSFKRYIKDVIQYLGATYVDALRYSSYIVGFEKGLADLVLTGKENKTQPRYTRLKVRELDREFYPIQFYKILTSTLPILNSDTIVLVENFKYFSELPHFVVSSTPKIVNLYIIWRYVAEYVPTLSEDIMATDHVFRTEIMDKHEPMARWEFCISTLEKYAGFYLLALFENQTSIEEKEKIRSIVTQIFSEMSSTVRRNLKLNNFTIEQKYIDKLSQVKIQIGLSSHMLKEQYTNDYYNNFNAFLSNFGPNVRIARSFNNMILGKKLKHPVEEDMWLDNMISSPVAVTYNAASNYIVVPWPVLQQPYFEKDHLLPSLYGGIGIEIAKAFIKSFLPDNTEEERNKYASAISHCVLGKDFTSLNLTDTNEFIVTLAALKFSYESLIEELSLMEDIHQPVMESFKSEELFFISYVQSICSARTDIRTLNEIFSKNINDFSLSNTALYELPEFTELYSCNQSSAYSSSLCKV